LEIEKVCKLFVEKYELLMRHGLTNARIRDEKAADTGVPKTSTLYFFKIPFSKSSKPQFSAV